MTTVIEHSTPREMGYRMPAEWEKQAAVWFQWPGRHPNSSGERDLTYQMKMEKTWMLMVWEIHRNIRVRILVGSEEQKQHVHHMLSYFGFDVSQVELYVTPIIDVWHRDTGPVFVVDDNDGIAVTDWNFNGWGSYPRWGVAERHIPETVAELLDVPVFKAPLVSEGGAIEVNGTGSFMATRSSIINDNRNPGMSQTEIEQALSDYLNVTNFIWLSGAPPEVCERELGDGTDYHIDIAARFAGKSTVLYAWAEDRNDPRYPYLVKHLEELHASADEEGNSLRLIPIALPEGGVSSIGERYDPVLGSGSNFTGASYLNYLVTNDFVLVPAFGNANDVKAQKAISGCFSDRKIVPVPVVSLTAEGGAVHCVTQQQPAA